MSTAPQPCPSGAGVPPPGLQHLLARLEERGVAAHGRAVAAMAGRVCRALSLPDPLTAQIELASLLHDAGKVELSPAVLDRPGPLSPEEWRLVREHPARGERLVAAVPGLARLAPLLRSHHERWDGRGYPDRLRGDAIPLGARVIHACDAFDAMTQPRCYRTTTLDASGACAELQAAAGTQFDPVVARAIVAIVLDR